MMDKNYKQLYEAMKLERDAAVADLEDLMNLRKVFCEVCAKPKTGKMCIGCRDAVWRGVESRYE